MLPSTLSTEDEQQPVNSVKHIPVDIDGNRISFKGNPAYVAGALYEASQYYERTGYYEALIKDGAVALSNGRLALDSVKCVSLVSGAVEDQVTYDFFNPCPPSTERIANYDAAQLAAGGGSAHPAYTAPTTLTPEQSQQFTVAKYSVSAGDHEFHSSLLSICDDSDLQLQFTAESKSSGRALVKVMIKYGLKATATDKALASSEYTNFITKGHQGELTLKSFNSYFKEHQRLVRQKPSTTRPSSEEVCEHLRNVMHKDVEQRKAFELLSIVQPVGDDVDKLVAQIRELLRANKTADELDHLTTTGDTLKSLTAQQIRDLSKVPEAALTAQAGRALAQAKQSGLLAAPDPQKSTKEKPKAKGGGRGRGGGGRGNGGRGNGGGDEKKKFVIPRDENGRITHWVEGMSNCPNCNERHLVRDCKLTSAPAPAKPQVAAVTESGPCGECDQAPELDAALAEQLRQFYEDKGNSTLTVVQPTAKFHTSLAVTNDGAARNNGESGLLEEAQARGLEMWPVEPNGQTLLRQFVNSSYSDLSAVGFWAVNGGPFPGVYFGDWSDISPYITGFSVRPGATPVKRFKREIDALEHCRLHSGLQLVDYALTDTRPSAGVPLGTLSTPPAEPQAQHVPQGTIGAGGGTPPAAPGRNAPPAIGFWSRHGAFVTTALVGILLGMAAMALVVATAPALVGLPPPADVPPAISSGALDGEAYADHLALTAESTLHRVYRPFESLSGVQAFALLQLFTSMAMVVFFFWPSHFTRAALTAPRDVAYAVAFVAAIPAFALAPPLVRLTTRFFSALGSTPLVTQGPRSLNFLRRALPALVAFACLLSASCFGGASTTPPGSVSISTTANTSISASIAGYCPSLAESTNGVTALTPAASAITSVALPFLGSWYPSDLDQKWAPESSHAALANVSEATVVKSSATGLPVFGATPDSGATATLTNDCRRLVDIRPCDEVFGGADGRVVRATCIGSMPVITKTTEGTLIRFSFTNVRCVPPFKYTLLSVTQMWKEQQIDARFADLNHLQLPASSGNFTVPYDRTLALSTLVLVSEAELSSRSKRSPANSRSPPAGHTSLSSEAALLQQIGGHIPHRALLGFHSLKSTSHVARLPSSQAGELMHRRMHRGVDVVRAAPNITADAPRNLTSATKCSCTVCAMARAKQAKHPGKLRTPAPEPGVLHTDMKGPFKRSIGGALYAMFFIDEHTRYVWVEFLKSKSEVVAATARTIANFNASVGTPIDGDGVPLARPTVRTLHSDHEGGLESHAFDAFRAEQSLHSEMSPPHDHDLNPISESIIRVIDELAVAFKLQGNVPDSLWPYVIRHAVDVHNCSSTSVGTSTSDANISAYQRFTLRQPNIMDLAPIGVRAVVLAPPQHRNKGGLNPRGYVGKFLGRSTKSINCWDVWANGKVISSSSVVVDEEFYDWRVGDAYQPLLPATGESSLRQSTPLPLGTADDGKTSAGTAATPPSAINAPAGAPRQLAFLDLYSGAYDRPDSLSKRMISFGWTSAQQVDNDPLTGGGWAHDVMNDETYTRLKLAAHEGAYDAIMIAEACSTYSPARFFNASTDDSDDPGPPPVRTHEYPDGLPSEKLDGKHVNELRRSNERLRRTVDIAIAAHQSPRRTTIIVENPADYSDPTTSFYSKDLANHGSIWRTSQMKRLRDAIQPCSTCTFAACRFGLDARKYTTLLYTNDAASVLNPLNGPNYQCNHTSHTNKAGGRGDDGSWTSKRFGAYTNEFITRLAMAFTCARTGDPRPLHSQNLPSHNRDSPPSPPVAADAAEHTYGDPSTHAAASRTPASPAPVRAMPSSSAAASPVPFAGFDPSATPAPSTAVGGGGIPFSKTFSKNPNPPTQPTSPLAPPQQRPAFHPRAVRSTTRANTAAADERASGKYAIHRDLPPVEESYSTFTGSPQVPWGLDDQPSPSPAQTALRLFIGSDVSAGANVSFPAGIGAPSADTTANSIDAQVHQALAAARTSGTSTLASDVAENGAIDVALNHLSSGTQAVSHWYDMGGSSIDGSTHAVLSSVGATEINPNTWTIDVSEIELNLISNGDHVAAISRLHGRVHHALRADSDGAPSTHEDVVRLGEPWLGAELKELGNHANNGSWKKIKASEKPYGRRVHKMVWVYKLKRDGTAKARLCVQGCTLESGVDYDQTFSSTLRYSSARALFAFAARRACHVRSIDYVAAYLQGEFVEGEAVYCRMPAGYEEKDSDGNAYILKIIKPIYGIPQAGRRLQRRVFPWMVDTMGLRQLDDSDSCIFVYDDPAGKETFVIGVYVDNLQVIHSADLGDNGDAIDKSSFYHRFSEQLRRDWDIVDEGPMVDLLAIEVERRSDGAIKLHQRSYVDKLLAKYMPNGVPRDLERATLNVPYSDKLMMNLIVALDSSTAGEPSHPELVKPFQERMGALLYLATSTRADLAFVVPLLCRAMSRPTPELLRETDYVLAYLHNHRDVGLTYSTGTSTLSAYSDASWETRSSTSGWVVFWQGCAVLWGSRKQHCVALSSCEAEIVALSEAAKDVVYVRKLLRGVDDSHVAGPSDLATDNMGARSLSYNPEHHDKTKHIERRHFFVRDMVEKFEINVPFVRTANNWADFFTKPLKPKAFRAMRKIIMNEPDS